MADDEPNGAVLSPWTIKDMPRDMSAKAVAYARRHQIPVAQVVAEALALRLDQHMPSKPLPLVLSDQRIPSKPPSSGPTPADTLATVATAIGALAGTRGVPKATRQAIDATALMVLRGVRLSLSEGADRSEAESQTTVLTRGDKGLAIGT